MICITENWQYNLTASTWFACKHGMYFPGVVARAGGLSTQGFAITTALHGQGGQISSDTSASRGGVTTVFTADREDDCIFVHLSMQIFNGPPTWRANLGIYSIGEIRAVGAATVETWHLHLETTANLGEFAFRKTQGGTNLATFTLPVGLWYSVNFKVRISSSSGQIEVRFVSDTGVASTPVNLGSLNTQNAGSGSTGLINAVHLGKIGAATAGSGTSILVDDYFVVNEQGPAPCNGFMGACTVVTTNPNAAGDFAQWTTNAAFNWSALQDTSADIFTDWNETAVVGNQDKVNFPNLTGVVPSTYTAAGMAVYTTAQKQDTGTASLAITTTQGGVTVQSPDIPIRGTAPGNADPVGVRQFHEIAPDGGAWTQAKVDNTQTGYVYRP